MFVTQKTQIYKNTSFFARSQHLMKELVSGGYIDLCTNQGDDS